MMKKAKKEIFFMSHEINKDKQTDRGLENQGTEKSTKITAVVSGSSKFYLILTQHWTIFPIPLKQLSYIKIFPFYYRSVKANVKHGNCYVQWYSFMYLKVSSRTQSEC